MPFEPRLDHLLGPTDTGLPAVETPYLADHVLHEARCLRDSRGVLTRTGKTPHFVATWGYERRTAQNFPQRRATQRSNLQGESGRLDNLFNLPSEGIANTGESKCCVPGRSSSGLATKRGTIFLSPRAAPIERPLTTCYWLQDTVYSPFSMCENRIGPDFRKTAF